MLDLKGGVSTVVLTYLLYVGRFVQATKQVVMKVIYVHTFYTYLTQPSVPYIVSSQYITLCLQDDSVAQWIRNWMWS